MAGSSLVLYIDIVSPFAYIAFHIIRNDPVFKDVQITYTPVLLGGIMQATGNTAPIKIKHKDKWIAQERLRWAHKFQVPVAPTMPPGFPANTLFVQRALIAISILRPQALEDAIAAIYEASFVRLEQVHDEEHVTPILMTLFGAEDARQIVEMARSGEVKKALTANTDQLLGEGAFGLPWFKCTDSQGQIEVFWGVDHLGMVCDHLGLEKPMGRSIAGWKVML